MSIFRLERGRVGKDKHIIYFETAGAEQSIFSEILVWMAPWIPDGATPEWIETDPDFRANFEEPDKIIPALAAYLRAVETARITRDPQLVRDLNELTGWIEWVAGYVKHSRMIDEGILDMASFEIQIQSEIARKTSPRFLPEEYARLRRLGYKPGQIDYHQIYRPE